MSTGLGTLAKAAFRIEGASISGAGLTTSDYPKTPTEADAEEVALGASDQLALLSEGVEEEYSFENDETLIGRSGVAGIDAISIMPTGGIEVSVFYDGMDAILAAALGFENPNFTNSPTYDSGVALTGAGGMSSNGFTATASVFAAGDVGKFIRVTSGTGAGQVRRITAYSGGTIVTVTPAWGTLPTGASAEMAFEFTHTFETCNVLSNEDWDQVYPSYPTTGVHSASDRIIRRGTLGFEKNQAKPWIFRSAMVNSLTFTASAGASIKASVDFAPFDLDRDSATNTASSTWDWDNSSAVFEENERQIFSDIDYFRLNAYSTGTALDSDDNICISDFTITINNNLQANDQTACTGLYREEPARGGMREVTGSFTLPRYEADTIFTWKDAETTLMGELSISGSTLTNEARNMKIFINSLKITKASAPVAGAGVITQTFEFVALVPSGQPASFPTHILTEPRPELQIQTINQNPFNVLLDQNREY